VSASMPNANPVAAVLKLTASILNLRLSRLSAAESVSIGPAEVSVSRRSPLIDRHQSAPWQTLCCAKVWSKAMLRQGECRCFDPAQTTTGLVLLCRKTYLPFKRPQHGQRRTLAARRTLSCRRSVVMALGTGRCARWAAARSATCEKGRHLALNKVLPGAGALAGARDPRPSLWAGTKNDAADRRWRPSAPRSCAQAAASPRCNSL
jgi:hypothetical protein